MHPALPQFTDALECFLTGLGDADATWSIAWKQAPKCWDRHVDAKSKMQRGRARLKKWSKMGLVDFAVPPPNQTTEQWVVSILDLVEEAWHLCRFTHSIGPEPDPAQPEDPETTRLRTDIQVRLPAIHDQLRKALLHLEATLSLGPSQKGRCLMSTPFEAVSRLLEELSAFLDPDEYSNSEGPEPFPQVGRADPLHGAVRAVQVALFNGEPLPDEVRTDWAALLRWTRSDDPQREKEIPKHAKRLSDFFSLTRQRLMPPAVGGSSAGQSTAADNAADSQPPNATANASPKKKSTAPGDAKDKILAALSKHHEYAKGSCLKAEPAGVNALAEQAQVAPSSVSHFFEKNFGGHRKYKSICCDPTRLGMFLKQLRGEYSPNDLFGRKPPGEDYRDDDD